MSKILRLLDLSFEAWATLDHTFHERLAGDLYEAIEDVRNENNTSQMEAFDEALEWAASWITGAQLLGRSEEIQEYARNMAMSIRAAKRGLTQRAPDACPYCAGKGEFINQIGKALRCNHCAGTGQRR
jgi:hypothetical protein